MRLKDTTIKAIAEKAGVTDRTCYNVFHMAKPVSTAVLTKIADAMNSLGMCISVNDLRLGYGVSNHPILTVVRSQEKLERTRKNLLRIKNNLYNLLSDQ